MDKDGGENPNRMRNAILLVLASAALFIVIKLAARWATGEI